MTPLDDYLQTHYLDAARFASSCGIALGRLQALVAARLVPAPSYVVTAASTVRSAPFGEMAAPDATPGEYFHPAQRTWVQRALAVDDADALQAQFGGHFAAALANLHRSVWSMPDSFDASGMPVADGIAARVEDAWESLLDGTFGLCVADPSSEASIARKEILQEKLTRITDNGTRVPSEPGEREALRELIARYASAAMPFSPVEYARSSRKRLVDDLRMKLDAD